MSTSHCYSPLHDRHVALGAKLADFGGWEMPIEYPGGGVLKEHGAVREAVGMFDVSHLGKMRVRGPGAAGFVNSVLCNDLSRIRAGQAQYSMLCNETGGVVDDLIVYLCSADEVFIVPNASNTDDVVKVLFAAAPAGLAVTDEHFEHAVIAVQGPASAAVLSAVGLPTDLDYMAFVEVQSQWGLLSVCRTGYTGEHGFELIAAWAAAEQIWDSLVPAVEGVQGRVAGLGARDTLRTEMGYPLHGQDLSPTISPVQARLGWAVGWDKEQFLGRTALLAERAIGPKRRLWGLLADARGIPRPHMPVTDRSGKVAGKVTSGTFSPTLRQGIGLALLVASVSEGDTVSVDVRGRPVAMRVVKPPFVTASTQ